VHGERNFGMDSDLVIKVILATLVGLTGGVLLLFTVALFSLML
jgi:hypothetical protein